VTRDPVDRSMVAAISQVGKAMGIHTIAERVESIEVLQELGRLGIAFARASTLRAPTLRSSSLPPQLTPGRDHERPGLDTCQTPAATVHQERHDGADQDITNRTWRSPRRLPRFRQIQNTAAMSAMMRKTTA